MRRIRIALVCTAILATPAVAAGPCRLALLLALDMSSSVDAAENRLQRAGLAAALEAPEVVAALLARPDVPVALAAYEWSGRYQQAPVLPWTLLSDRAAIARAAAAIRGSRRAHGEFPTALGYALGHAATWFRTAPPCDRQVLDVSGDGRVNDGFPPALAYAHFPLAGITVNGLAIVNEDPDLVAYYRAELIRGAGAFVIDASDYGDFERAMRAKLLRELDAMVLGARP